MTPPNRGIMGSTFLLLAFQAIGVSCSLQLLATCNQIAAAISSASSVHLPGDLLYVKDISHWASSSSETSACSVEPGSVEDVSTIIQILGSTRTPFAVKGGGHSSNPGFSSTPGVQIAMYKFSEVVYHPENGTADIGTGLVWDDVYSVLQPHNVSVVGGRVTGVGVAGFTLGGGYSWFSNQYGLTIDTVQAFELVLPNGTFVRTTEEDYPDLFFGLKGGLNNFGIVTKISLSTIPVGQVWGGLITYTADQIPAVVNATSVFSTQNQDLKAQIITTFNTIVTAPGVSLLVFYDGPTPPSGIFDTFLSIPHFTSDVSTRSFTSLVAASPANATSGTRAVFSSIGVLELTPSLVAQVANQSKYWGANLATLLDTGLFISVDVEPFHPSYFSHSKGGAYPHSPSLPLLPLFVYFAWALPTSDPYFLAAIKESTRVLLDQAAAEGQNVIGDNQIVYSNYALPDTPLSELFGGNVDRLKSIKQTYDPQNVMGLAGGFKF